MLSCTVAGRPSWRRMATIRKGDCSLDEPKKLKMAEWYSDYSKTYDQNGYHTPIAKKLVEGLAICQGDRILDIATGTGLAGMFALEQAEPQGHLVAVDISGDMLDVAKKAFEAKGFKNVELILADGQKLDLEEASFDALICSSALVLFPDVQRTLTYWRKFLRPGGQLAVHCFSEKSYVRGKLIQIAASKYGIELIFSEPTGTIKKCKRLLENSGYIDIRVEEVPRGSFITLESVLSSWDKLIHHPMVQLPALVSPDTLQSMKEEFYRLANEINTLQGIWDDDIIMYVYGKRPDQHFINN